MNIKDVMTESPACCTADVGLQDVAKMMVDHDCGCIPVVDDTESKMPIGMITDRDITCRVVAQGQNPLDLTAGDAMTASVVSISPEMSLEECLNLMEDSQIRRIAVVDGSGCICGIVSQADVATKTDSAKTAEVVQQVSRVSA